MAIKSLTERARIATIGHLRMGAEAAGGVGADLGEMMRFTSDDPAVVDSFTAAFGSELVKRLVVRLFGGTVDEIMETWNEAYSAGGLARRCDGETCVMHRGADGRMSHTPTPCAAPNCQTIRGRPAKCAAVGRLSVIVPELLRAGHLGRVVVHTTSVNAIGQVLERLRGAEMAATATGTQLNGMQVILFRSMKEISTPSDNGPVRRKKWLLDLSPDREVVAMAAAGPRALSAPEAPRRALQAPDDAAPPMRLSDYRDAYAAAAGHDGQKAHDVLAAWIDAVRMYLPRCTTWESCASMRTVVQAMPACDGRRKLEAELEGIELSMMPPMADDDDDAPQAAPQVAQDGPGVAIGGDATQDTHWDENAPQAAPQAAPRAPQATAEDVAAGWLGG